MAKDLKDQQVMVKYGHNGHQMHCSVCTLTHSVALYGNMEAHQGGAGYPGWESALWCCCNNALCKSVPGGRKHPFVLHAGLGNPALWEKAGGFWLAVQVWLPLIKAEKFTTIWIIFSAEEWEWNGSRQKTTRWCMFRRKCVQVQYHNSMQPHSVLLFHYFNFKYIMWESNQNLELLWITEKWIT